MITINKTRAKNKNYQFAYITLAADGNTCRMVVSTPVIPDLQTYCNAHEAEYKIGILGAMYPDARWQDSEGKTDIEKFENWIADGAINSSYLSEDDKDVSEQVIEKVAWVDMFGEQTKLEQLTDRVTALETSLSAVAKPVATK